MTKTLAGPARGSTQATTTLENPGNVERASQSSARPTPRAARLPQEKRLPTNTKWSAKWNQPKYWRLRATATDGLIVTLGRYETAEEAHADSNKFAEGGRYRDLAVQAIEPRPDAAVAETGS